VSAPGAADEYINVADGMGGHNAGEVASSEAVSGAVEFIEMFGLLKTCL
jgi:serine/threonine protein phosphatase PrpC